VLFVYDNWSAYDELSDNVPLTEELTMAQFGELLRLRRNGVKIDAYLMDAFWYERDGGYRVWNRQRWPQGPDRWLAACAEHGVTPGLWFPANTAFHMEPPAEWADSLAEDGWGFCLFEGGFWPGFLAALEYWYGRGIRLFKFDFADFGAAPEATKLQMLPSEIRARNIAAYREGLLALRSRCPDALFLGYNGFEEAEFMPWTDRPIRRVLDPAWLDVFETMYSGDPRPADVPLYDFWRTLDVYADHMVRHLHARGYPLDRIDNCSFMMGKTGTCYRRGKAGWRSSYLLSLARGGKVHMMLGNLEQFDDEDARWMARVQALYLQAGTPTVVGGLPGKGELYGYQAGRLLTLVNPSLVEQRFPVGAPLVYVDGSVLIEDGYAVLGSGAVAVFGSASLDSPDVATTGLSPVACDWSFSPHACETIFTCPGSEVHLVFEQRDAKGLAVRTSGGAPPDGASMAGLLRIEAFSGDEVLEVERPDDHILWSGLSWAYGVVRGLTPGTEIRVRMSTSDTGVAKMLPSAWA
jgi:hypothetical protein